MTDVLAKRLLTKVMKWEHKDVKREYLALQALAAYKYDEYQQFSPGKHFVRSLASWLEQFKPGEERQTAYEFIKSRLVFCSSAEMDHLVSIAYPDHIRPFLLQRVAADDGLDEWLVSKIATTCAFKIRQRQCLFLGLSDGACIDVFRRSNSSDLTHEQILQTYEISKKCVTELLDKLSEDVKKLSEGDALKKPPKFRTIVLLDDFSGSGYSYIRRENGDSFDGKIGRLHQNLISSNDPVSELIDIKETEILIVLYMATEQARERIEKFSKKICRTRGVKYHVMVVHKLDDSIRLHRDGGDAMTQIINTYYDPKVEDQHMKIGKTKDLKYGFAGCGLPLVLGHNTPNNSLPLLWYDSEKVKALFPRVSRHK